MLAGDLELAALLLDLAEQSGILDRESRLRREGLEQVDDFRRELARRSARERKAAENAPLTQQRYSEQSANAGRCGRTLQRARIRALRQHIGDLYRSARRRRPPGRAVSDSKRRCEQQTRSAPARSRGSPADGTRPAFVELVDDAAVGRRELDRTGDDRGEDLIADRASN